MIEDGAPVVALRFEAALDVQRLVAKQRDLSDVVRAAMQPKRGGLEFGRVRILEQLRRAQQ